MKLLIGLGNPGPKYKKTRHNAGALVIEKFLEIYGLKPKSLKKCQALIAKIKLMRQDVILAVPQTFMNESGQAVAALVKYYKVKPKDIIVISDDIDLPLGTIRIRENSSAGGHKGLESIIDHLRTRNFVRVRIGIGPQPSKIPSEKYVLQNFKKDEWQLLQEETILKTIQAMVVILKDGIDKAMNTYN